METYIVQFYRSYLTPITESNFSPVCKLARVFVLFLGGGEVSDPSCLSSSSALHFSNYFFLVNHPVNWDDRHLLAHAAASDLTVTRQS
jgi:hypothetical protein